MIANIFAALFACFGMLLMYYAKTRRKSELLPLYWPSCKGTWLSCDLVKKYRISDGVDIPMYMLTVSYQYFVNEMKFINSVIYRGCSDGIQMRNVRKGEECVRKLRKTQFNVYYDKSNPSESCLTITTEGSESLYCGGNVCIFVAITIILLSYRGDLTMHAMSFASLCLHWTSK